MGTSYEGFLDIKNFIVAGLPSVSTLKVLLYAGANGMKLYP
jgi:hypothetical protein